MSEPTYRYTPYELLLCRIDEDCDLEKHPNGQTKLYSYNADGFAETVNDEMHHLNDDTWISEKLRASVTPIPMGEINRHKLLMLLRQAEVVLSTAIHNCDSHAMDKDLRAVDEYLCKAIEEVDSDA